MKSTPLGTCFVACIALLPFITSTNLFYGTINAKFFFIVALVDAFLLFGAYVLMTKKHITFSLGGKWFAGALLLVLLGQYLSAVLGVFPERSLWSDIFWSSGVLFLTHLALLVVLLGTFLSERDWTNSRRAVIVSAGIFALLTIIGVNGLGVEGMFLWLNLGLSSISIGNEVYAAAYLLLSFMFGLIELGRSEPGSVWRKVILAALVLIFLSPLLSGFVHIALGITPLAELLGNPGHLLGYARASSATLFVLLSFLVGRAVLNRVLPTSLRTKGILVFGALTLIGIAALVGLLLTPGSVVQEEYIQESSAARIIVWDAGMRAFSEKPVTGWGPENFNYAVERNFDNQLFLNKNLGEIWFERAHNVFIDTLVSTGVVGMALGALLVLAFVIVVYRARRKGVIGDTEAVLLYAFVPVHLLQMQTGFDTVGSYTLLAVIGGYIYWLERQASEGQGTPIPVPDLWTKIGAGVLVLAALLSLKFVVLDEYARQTALVSTFREQTAGKQLAALNLSLSRESSFESLRLSSASFIRGALETIAIKSTPERQKQLLVFLSAYEKQYTQYLTEHPDHYRARMNYAYLLLIKTTLGENRILDAKEIIQDSYDLSPGNPLTYILGALAELYGGDLKEMDRLMNEALAINPGIEFTQEAKAYFDTQKKLFPNITVLKLENL